MPTLVLNDSQKDISITVANNMNVDNAAISQLTSTLDVVNIIMPISTIGLSGSTYTVTLKDARVYAVDVNGSATPPSFQFTSPSFWNQMETIALQGLATALNYLILVSNMSALTVIYA
jgi:hypothetical protein